MRDDEFSAAAAHDGAAAIWAPLRPFIAAEARLATRIAELPLFTGFMYSCIGSDICRAWRLFDFRFKSHPPRWSLVGLSCAIYANFFAHHYMPDLRILLFAAAILLFGRTTIYFKVWRDYRSMPLLLGLFLVSLFVWLSENIGTFTQTWLYPSQRHGWTMVAPEKLGSWFLLLIISYTLVSLIYVPQAFIARKTPKLKPGEIKLETA